MVIETTATTYGTPALATDAAAEESARAEETRSWSYDQLTRAETMWGPHAYHRYPAKFIPQLARRIIDEYSDSDAFVADPFSGSGTAGIEALRAGRRVWLGDINPVATLVSAAKCHPLNPEALTSAWADLNGSLSDVAHIGSRPLTKVEKAAISEINISRATSEQRWTYWFPAAHRDALGQIVEQVKAIPEGPTRTFFLCAFSNILRGCSIWLSGSTKPQKDLSKTLADPLDAFRRQVRGMLQGNALYWADLAQAGRAPAQIAERYQVRLADARALPLQDSSVDLLLTSPPYSTCYEYAELHQLTHLWLDRYGLLPDLDEGTDRETTEAITGAIIGTKGRTILERTNADRVAQQITVSDQSADAATRQDPQHRLGPQDAVGAAQRWPCTGSQSADAAIELLEAKAIGPKANSVSREVRALVYYFLDMQVCIQQFARVVRPGRCLVLVIGDSKKRGITIPTSSALSEMASSCGFTLERRIVRQIPSRILTRTRDATTGRFSSTADHSSQAYPEEDILVFRRSCEQPAVVGALEVE